MKKTEQTQAGGDELREVLEENERLRAENRRLKVLLESFAIRPASSLPTPLSERRDKETPRPQSQPTQPLAPTRSIARVAEGTAPPVETPDRLSTRKEKIDLFRSLFRGREDVYAVRWENRKGRSGYSPACANEWNRPICQKPCSRCQNSKYIPVSDETIQDHVLGKHTIGVYPLLQDETCWFLAADFDKDGWQEDARAFARIPQTSS